MRYIVSPSEALGETPYVLAARLFEELDKLRRVWKNFRPVPCLRNSEFGVLMVVVQLLREGGEPVTVSRLARVMGQTRAGVSQKVSKLESQGYLRRLSHKEDRRVATLELTEDGTELAQKSMRHFLGKVESALDLLGGDKTNTLLVLMRELSESIEKVQQEGAKGH